jgi:hypothetical protein
MFVLAIGQYVRLVFLCEMAVLFWLNGFLFVDLMHAATVNLYMYDVYNKSQSTQLFSYEREVRKVTGNIFNVTIPASNFARILALLLSITNTIPM